MCLMAAIKRQKANVNFWGLSYTELHLVADEDFRYFL